MRQKDTDLKIDEMGNDPVEFLNAADQFKRLYYLYSPRKLDERALMAIINKYGYKHVNYALKRLYDEILDGKSITQPYAHFDRAVGNFKRRYDAVVAQSKQARPA